MYQINQIFGMDIHVMISGNIKILDWLNRWMLWYLEDTIQHLRSHDLVNTIIISDSEIQYITIPNGSSSS